MKIYGVCWEYQPRKRKYSKQNFINVTSLFCLAEHSCSYSIYFDAEGSSRMRSWHAEASTRVPSFRITTSFAHRVILASFAENSSSSFWFSFLKSRNDDEDRMSSSLSCFAGVHVKLGRPGQDGVLVALHFPHSGRQPAGQHGEQAVRLPGVFAGLLGRLQRQLTFLPWVHLFLKYRPSNKIREITNTYLWRSTLYVHNFRPVFSTPDQENTGNKSSEIMTSTLRDHSHWYVY